MIEKMTAEELLVKLKELVEPLDRGRIRCPSLKVHMSPIPETGSVWLTLHCGAVSITLGCRKIDDEVREIVESAFFKNKLEATNRAMRIMYDEFYK